VLFLGFMPLCNAYEPIGEPAKPCVTYPTEILLCPRCELVQMGHVVDQRLLFPADYPYTSSTTKALRDNFADLADCCARTIEFKRSDLVVDIGSNDGTLLSNFLGTCMVYGVTPEDAAMVAIERDIPTTQAYFTAEFAKDMPGLQNAMIITCTNCFAHVPDPHDFLEGVTTLLAPGGIFIAECQYVHSLLDGLQFDHFYHEHLRFYSLASLSHLLAAHGLEPFRVQRIPTHGGSIRVWACRKGERQIETSVAEVAFWEEKRRIDADRFYGFRSGIEDMRTELWQALGTGVHGIGAPSRASTLLRYCGIDHGVLPVTYEAPGSARIDRFIPGSRIAVATEPSASGADQPETLLLLSHHIAGELIPKLRAKGFGGRFILPLPSVEVIDA